MRLSDAEGGRKRQRAGVGGGVRLRAAECGRERMSAATERLSEAAGGRKRQSAAESGRVRQRADTPTTKQASKSKSHKEPQSEAGDDDDIDSTILPAQSRKEPQSEVKGTWSRSPAAIHRENGLK